MTTQYGTRYRLDFNGIFEQRTQDLFVEPTDSTPFVKYCRDENVLMIKGNSSRAGIDEFYKPLISQAKIHLNEGLKLDVILFYNSFDPETIEILLQFFEFIGLKKAGGVDVSVTWCSETSNREMYEIGEDFLKIHKNLDFKLLTL